MTITDPEKQPDECVVHDHPVPATQPGRYDVDRDPHSEHDIASYIEGQAPDEEVQDSFPAFVLPSQLIGVHTIESG